MLQGKFAQFFSPRIYLCIKQGIFVIKFSYFAVCNRFCFLSGTFFSLDSPLKPPYTDLNIPMVHNEKLLEP